MLHSYQGTRHATNERPSSDFLRGTPVQTKLDLQNDHISANVDKMSANNA